MKKINWHLVKGLSAALGAIVLVATGYGFATLYPGPKQIGLPLGVVLSFLGTLLISYYREHYSIHDLKKEQHIEETDERNIALRNRAKAKAFDIMQPFCLYLAMISIHVENRFYLLLLFVLIPILALGLEWWYRHKYANEM